MKFFWCTKNKSSVQNIDISLWWVSPICNVVLCTIMNLHLQPGGSDRNELHSSGVTIIDAQYCIDLHEALKQVAIHERQLEMF